MARYRRFVAMVGVLALCVAGGLTAATRPQPTVPVPAPAQGPADVEDLGDTYHHLEGRAARVTTRYADGTVIGHRELDGTMAVRLFDAGGSEVAGLALKGDTVLFRRPGEPPSQHKSRRGRATLEWANAQLRMQTSARGADPLEIEAEFDGSLVATTMKSRSEWTTVLTRYGAEVGRLRYLPKEQVLAWRFPGLTEGWLSPERLRDRDGWGFTRTMGWANVQALAFYEFHSRLKALGAAGAQAAAVPAGDARRHWLQAVVDTVVVPLSANEPGCDNLHWLDGSMVRPCCDTHDRCYEYYGCTSRSWWWGSWNCTKCNLGVVACFASGGGFNGPYYQTA
jgi:hypothetical protein